ncbi:MAG: glycosyltransferase [Bacteroidales bacterium]|nr:glycosyltransferase [Bacteroidales bacterium]
MKVLQINTTIQLGSTGRIASAIEDFLKSQGHYSVIAYGRDSKKKIPGIKIGTRIDFYGHIVKTRILDRHGFGSKRATKKLITRIKSFDPDIIHLHNIHGYFLHIGVLFGYLKSAGKPVVWTFHDCWPFTGHCSFFDRFDCTKWQTECFKCPLKSYYPRSLLMDNSTMNFREKKFLFSLLENLTLVSPSEWLAAQLRKSFLRGYPIRVINNGVDLDKFKPADNEKTIRKYGLKGKFIVLGAANKWDKRKGLPDFIELRSLLRSDIEIVLIGLSYKQISSLPKGICGISRTESIEELASFYSIADVFVNPTYVDNFPTTNIESLACGTPVITYRTGGSHETIDSKCGLVIPKGDIRALYKAVEDMILIGKNNLSGLCRTRAEQFYSKNNKIDEYLNLYNSLYLNTNRL